MSNFLAFRDWLQGEMNRQGISQSDLVHLSGLKQSAVSLLLRGERGLSRGLTLDTLKGIARGLRMHPAVLLANSGLIPPLPGVSRSASEISYLIDTLPDEERTEIMDYARFKFVTTRKRTQPCDDALLQSLVERWDTLDGGQIREIMDIVARAISANEGQLPKELLDALRSAGMR